MRHDDKEICVLTDVESKDVMIEIYKSRGYILINTYLMENERMVQLFFIKSPIDDEDKMIGAKRKSSITKQDLIDTFTEKGLVGVYNLGLKDMLDYLNSN